MNYLLAGQFTDRLLFEKIDTIHFHDWLKFFQDPQTSIHWVGYNDTPDIACEKWYQKQFWRYQNGKGGMNALIEKESGKLVGHAGLLVQTVDDVEELEIGYSLLPAFWKRGYAFEAALKCKRYAFQNDFSESLISIISLSNLPSQAVAIKNGMRVEKKTMYHDNEVFVYRISKPDYLNTFTA